METTAKREGKGVQWTAYDIMLEEKSKTCIRAEEKSG